MVRMTALVGFSDPDLRTEGDPRGGVAANAPFTAPSAEIANRLEAAGLAERTKADAPAKSSKEN